MYRLTGWTLLVLGVALAIASVGFVFTWGLGAVIAVAAIVAGAVILTDRREPRHRRPCEGRARRAST